VNVLEIPLTNFEISLQWQIKRVLKKLFLSGRGYPIGKRNPAKIVNHPEIFKKYASEKFIESKENNCTSFLVSYFHADELLEKRLNVSTYFENNLRSMYEASKKYDVPFRFLTAREAGREIII